MNKLLISLATLCCFFILIESRIYHPNENYLSHPQWEFGGKTPKENVVSLYFALKQKNLDQLDELLVSVSDPKSPDYGRYVTHEYLRELLSPGEEVIENIKNWIRKVAPEATLSVPLTGDWIIARLTVGSAERLLNTEFHEFKHVAKDIVINRSKVQYSIPRYFENFIDFVGGVHGHLAVNIDPQFEEKKSEFAQQVTPDIAKGIFNISKTLSATNSGTTQATANFLEQYISISDLKKFFSDMDLPYTKEPSIHGPNNQTEPGIEASLDIQYIMGMGLNVTTAFISFGGRHEGQEPFLEWISTLLNTTDAPLLHSASYGDVESTIELDYATRCNVEFQKFGTLGHTIFFASGDDGAGCADKCSSTSPNWPASSPFVVAVGGVVYEGDDKVEGDRISSGGFSNYFSQYSAQSDAVNAYLSSSNLPTTTSFNKTGRGIPDIASFSEDVQIDVFGLQFGIGGTSCASPTMAGVFSLINDARLNAGQPSLGYLNPLLYTFYSQNNDAFIDVTEGNNADSCCQGYTCTDGWDAVTGLGLPNFPVLVSMATDPNNFGSKLE